MSGGNDAIRSATRVTGAKTPRPFGGMLRWAAAAIVCVTLAQVGSAETLTPAANAVHVEHLAAQGADSRVDLQWGTTGPADAIGFNIYRSDRPAGPFRRVNASIHPRPLYSDFVGDNGRTCYYRVTAVTGGGEESAPSTVASAHTVAMTDDELLTSVERATFRYFWDFGHPVSGLTRSRTGAANRCTIGGTGFGLLAIMIGTDRGFVTREHAAARITKILRFLATKTDRFHGAFPHWVDGRTGRVIPFSRYDDGADLVETSYLVQGLLAVRQYFNRPDPVEAEVRTRCTELWEQVDWKWFLREPGQKQLYWHWTPTHGWKNNLKITGYNECLITYLLAIASPTHPIPADCYENGWAADRRYINGVSYYGQKQWVGDPLGGPLFWTQYSFLALDPRGRRDAFCDYFQNGRAITLIHRAYATANPAHHRGYGPDCWGITACDTPDGYRALSPREDDGTIAPTAAISAMPFTPRQSLAALKHFYHQLGPRLWGEFGFRDAFNLDRNWFADSYLAVDEGPILCMIENARTGLCWRMFMANPEVAPALTAAGWHRTGPEEAPPPTRPAVASAATPPKAP